MINVLRGRGAAKAAGAPPAGVMITDDQPDVLSCPACGRPLEGVNGRCPGCGTLLVLGVQARRAGVFTAFGLVVGLLVGAMVMGMVTTATAPAAKIAGSGSQTGGPSTDPAPVGPAVPTAAKSALSQSAVVNGRLVVGLGSLQVVLAAMPLDTGETAKALRALAADAALGAQIVPGFARWPSATQLSADLTSFYGSIRAAAREGLSASLANVSAYKSAARRMVAVFASLSGIDAATQHLATEAGITVPSVARSTSAEPSTAP